MWSETEVPVRTTMVLFVLALSACGGGTSATHGATTSAPTFASQVERGATVYGAQCASCHGAAGEGAGAPRVVGLADGALPLEPRGSRTSRFETVADVAGYVVATMPPTAPGSLSEADYFAILAFDLHANGLDLDRPLDADVAATTTIPR